MDGTRVPASPPVAKKSSLNRSVDVFTSKLLKFNLVKNKSYIRTMPATKLPVLLFVGASILVTTYVVHVKRYFNVKF